MAKARRHLHFHDQRLQSSRSRCRSGPAGTTSLSGCMQSADQPIRIALVAPDGRMGRAIAAAIADDSRFALDQDHGDLLVDFSARAALESSLDRALAAEIPILIGTTGLDEAADNPIA